jgi:hypothetical protein
MKPEFREKLAQQPFEEKIQKVGELISLSRKVKADASLDSDENTGFNGAELSESVLARDWNTPEEDAAWSNL